MIRLAALAVVAFAVPVAAAEPPRFERDVKPILTAKCLKCHGADSTKASLDLRTAAAIKKGGETGPAIVPGASAKSLLLEQITSGAMPPGKTARVPLARKDTTPPRCPSHGFVVRALVTLTSVYCGTRWRSIASHASAG